MLFRDDLLSFDFKSCGTGESSGTEVNPSYPNMEEGGGGERHSFGVKLYLGSRKLSATVCKLKKTEKLCAGCNNYLTTHP